MTQTIAAKISLYEQDLNLWLETAIAFHLHQDCLKN